MEAKAHLIPFLLKLPSPVELPCYPTDFLTFKKLADGDAVPRVRRDEGRNLAPIHRGGNIIGIAQKSTPICLASLKGGVRHLPSFHRRKQA